MSNPDATGETRRHPRKRGTTDLYIDHGHYYVMHADAHPPGAYYTEWTDDKLLYPAPSKDEDGGIFVRTGTFHGPLTVTVETYDSADQALPDRGDWQIVHEVEIVARGPNLRVETDSGIEIDLPPLHVDPGQRAGARIHVRGFMDAVEAHWIRLADGPIEHHLLQLWRV